MRDYYGRSFALDRELRRRRRKMGPLGIIAAFAVVATIIILAATASLMHGTPGPERAYLLFTPITICSNGDVGQYSSLAIDPTNGNLGIAYYNATGGDLMTSSYNGATWSAPNTVYSSGDVGSFCSYTINSTGVKMASFYNATNGDLYFATHTGTITCIDATNDVGKYSSIDIQSISDSIAISYYDATTGDLKVAYNKSGNTPWVVYTVDTFGDVGQYSDILFMPMNDTIIVNYYNVSDTSLKQAWAWDLGSGLGPWYDMTIDNYPFHDVGKWVSQAGSATGIWYSSWYDATNGSLVYAYFSSESEMQWGVCPDTVGDVGQYTSIGCNSSGSAFISYYDNTNKDLKLAWNTSWGVWYNMTLDSVGDVGKYTSLRIDSSNAIHISYYDADNGDLKYVKVVVADLVMIPEFGDMLLPMAGIIITALAVSSARKRKAA